MKSLYLTIALTTPSLANDDISTVWSVFVDESKKETNISSSSSHTGHHGGVCIMTPSNLTFTLSGEGDPALVLHQAVAKKCSEWAKKNGASQSTSSVSGGQTTLRIKASNHDSLSLLYRPAPTKGGQGTFTVIFVDASEFRQKKE